MAFLGIIATVASAAVSAAGAMQAANAQAEAAKYNEKVQEQNARTAKEQAAAVAGQKMRENNQRLATGRAAATQNGFELSGSPMDVIDQANSQGYLDYLTAIYEGKVAATGYQNNAELYRMEAANARKAGAIGAGSVLLSGVSDAYRGRGQLTV